MGRRLCRNARSIKKEVQKFYKQLYQQDDIPSIEFQDSLTSKISKEEAQRLEQHPSQEEIKHAVWDCDASKAPRVDGYNMRLVKEL